MLDDNHVQELWDITMANVRQWCAARADKAPVNPLTGELAKVNDSSTWARWIDAYNRAKTIKGSKGVGFMFGEKPCGYAFIDLDHVIHDGKIEQYAQDLINLMDSYTEISQSGEGIHILFKLSCSLHDMNSAIETGFKQNGVEFYDSRKFCIITGNVYGAVKPINERTEQARQVVAKYFKQQSPAKSQRQQMTVSNIPDDDSELWELMFNASNGSAIRRLYNGDNSGYTATHADGNTYPDNNSADLALCSHLAFYTNCDRYRIDRMFRQTGLYREKWERTDYREATIDKAIAGTSSTYTGSVKQVSGANSQKQQPQTQKPSQSQESSEIKFSFNAEYLNSAFEADMKNFQRYSGRKTGFANLDGECDKFRFQKINLYPGLYVIGAVSSLGKSTFCLQMADQLAQRGEHVLFFAFEQSRFELVSKSLARLAQPENGFYESIPTAIEIREGRITPELRGAMQKYKELAGHYAIIECDFMYDVSTIIQTVEAYIKQFGVKPVVFVDYLQLVRSNNPKLTAAKDIVDDVIRDLKQLQKQNELIMFVVSSLNRQNYLTTIDFEAFKESGAIEYTADVVIGLQLAVMGNPIFENSHTSLNKKREIVKAAKRENPRRIELCVLKNRYGISNMTFYFNYYSKWDMFTPATVKDMIKANEDLLSSVKGDDDIDG